jgi:hypothetical protein
MAQSRRNGKEVDDFDDEIVNTNDNDFEMKKDFGFDD